MQNSEKQAEVLVFGVLAIIVVALFVLAFANMIAIGY